MCNWQHSKLSISKSLNPDDFFSFAVLYFINRFFVHYNDNNNNGSLTEWSGKIFLFVHFKRCLVPRWLWIDACRRMRVYAFVCVGGKWQIRLGSVCMQVEFKGSVLPMLTPPSHLNSEQLWIIKCIDAV